MINNVNGLSSGTAPAVQLAREWATFRNQAFFQSCFTKEGEDHWTLRQRVLSPGSVVDFCREYVKLGLPHPHAYLLFCMLWRSGEDLSYPTSIWRMSQDTGKARQAVDRQLRELAQAGLLERHQEINPGSWLWRFSTISIADQNVTRFLALRGSRTGG